MRLWVVVVVVRGLVVVGIVFVRLGVCCGGREEVEGRVLEIEVEEGCKVGGVGKVNVVGKGNR